MNDRRLASLSRLREESWDVLIVGGGINGAGIARDLVLRGAEIKVALVEKNHFASGTSGRNSQLIHGGLRYLKYFDFGLVREALHERAILLKIAPTLVEPLQFLIPCYRPLDRWFYGAGLTLYDALAGSRSIGAHRALNPSSLRELEPALNPENLRAGLLFYDAKVHAARLVLENLVDAESRGACVVNYVEARREPSGLFARDAFTGEQFPVRAKHIVDATGAWSSAPGLRLVRGSHLIYPRVQSGNEALAYFDEQGRIIFLIPWGERNDLTLVGTTDVDHDGSPDEVRISAAEKQYLESIVDRLYPEYQGEPIASYSALRPLIAASGRSATSTSREHRIWRDESGTLHVEGGKYTTYRSMSEELVDMLMDDLAPGRDLPGRTAETPLDVPPTPSATSDRIHRAVEREFARRLPDLLYVSTYWGHERAASPEWLRPLASEMGALLGWDASREADEVAEVMAASAF